MDIWSWFREKKKAYQLTFGSVSGKLVLEDLSVFCRASETCYHSDTNISYMLQGRREVWQRIQDYMGLTPEELIAMKALTLKTQGDDNG